MYITDKKTKQYICSYIKHRYGVGIESNRIYVFKYDYLSLSSSVYTITKYKDYISDPFPYEIYVKEIDQWGMILSRKEKIEKIQRNGNKQGHRGMVRY